MVEISLYQEECVNQVIELMHEGNKRLTVLVPTGGGNLQICLALAEKLCNAGKDTFIIAPNESIRCFINDQSFENKAYLNVKTVNSFLREKSSAECLILYCLDVVARRKMQAYAKKNADCIFISTGETRIQKRKFWGKGSKGFPFREQFDTLDTLAMQNKRLGKIKPLIYCTESIIDVRDIMLASPDEKQRILAQVEHDRIIMSQELFEFEKEKVTHEDEDLYERIAVLEKRLNFTESILVSIGFSQKLIDEEFKKIEALRTSLKDEFQNPDGSDNEFAISEFQSEVAKSISRFTNRVITVENSEYYKEILIDSLTRAVWEKKLESTSKRYLITAKMTFESLSQHQDRDSLDFCGVCMLLTKVLETELTKRLHERYSGYLKNKYPIPEHLNEWPTSMLNRDGTDTLKSKDFTLGSVSYVIGLTKEGNVRRGGNYPVFFDYAREELYKDQLTEEEVTTRIKNLVRSTEIIRTTYRNPSAHRASVNYVTAEACMDYMLLTYKKLKEILEDMKR